VKTIFSVKNAFLIFAVLLLSLFGRLTVFAQGFAASSDKEAVGMARSMVASLGGKEAWASARWLYVREEAYFSDRKQPAVAEYWRRFDEPGYWGRIISPEFSRRGSVTRNGSWREVDGNLSDRTREEHQNQVGWWFRDIYTMYHRLAKEDVSLRLVKSNRLLKRFEVINDETGEDLCWFEVDGSGAVVKWSTTFGIVSVEYIYGPLKSFGNIKMPAWGALVDGSFRFYYLAAELRTDSPKPPFEKPPNSKKTN
jgi:hypothetical protein